MARGPENDVQIQNWINDIAGTDDPSPEVLDALSCLFDRYDGNFRQVERWLEHRKFPQISKLSDLERITAIHKERKDWWLENTDTFFQRNPQEETCLLLRPDAYD